MKGIECAPANENFSLNLSNLFSKMKLYFFIIFWSLLNCCHTLRHFAGCFNIKTIRKENQKYETSNLHAICRRALSRLV